MAMRSANTYKFNDNFTILLWIKLTSQTKGGIMIKKAFDSYQSIKFMIGDNGKY